MVDVTEPPSSMDDANVIVQPRVNQIVDETVQIIKDPFHPRPNYPFIKSKDGKQNRSCQSHWFTDSPPDGFPWLHYRPESDSVICYICSNNYIRGNLNGVKNMELNFITIGFSNWKKAIDKFNKHEVSEGQKLSLTFETTVPKCKDIISLISTNAEESGRIETIYY